MQPTILVAAAPSERGRDALALGVSLARPLGTRLVLVDVAPEDRRDDGEERNRLLEQLDDLRASAPQDLEVSITVAIAPSRLRGLHEMAVELDAQVLVMSPEQRGFIGRALHGDLAADAVFTAPCAVAVASRRQSIAAPRQIGVAWNGAPASYEALEWATQIAERSEATVKIVRALDPRSPEGSQPEAGVHERAEELRAATRLRAPTELELTWGDAVPVLIEESRRLDLLVLGSRARSPLRRTLLGSVSTDLVHRAHCPVVVLPRGVHAPAVSATAH